jgi:anhydro-N-acetylmuramic acid kinase
VVSDLHSRDIAEGGQGTPLASIFDVLLLGGGETGALNLGGIANLTVVPGGDAGDPAFASPGRSPLVLPDPAPRAPGRLRIEAVGCQEV